MMPSQVCVFKAYLSARGFQNLALGIIFVVNALSAKCLGGCLLQLSPFLRLLVLE
jgi:hypothetical protein